MYAVVDGQQKRRVRLLANKTASKEEVLADFQGDGEMIEIPCSRKYSADQPVFVCATSGLVRARDVRSSEEIAKIWSEQIFGNRFDSARYTARIPAVVARQTYVAAFLNDNIGTKGKRICDIGAGEGQFLEIVTGPQYGALGYGIEPSSDNCKILQDNGFRCFQGTVEDYRSEKSLPKACFDAVSIMWTLCNTASAVDMIQLAYDLLKPGGTLVVAEGSRILVPFRKPLNLYFSSLPVDLHPYHFSANTLSGLLSVVGFVDRKFNRYIDSEYLCILGTKPIDIAEETVIVVDESEQVLEFFARWDRETQYYL